MYGTKPGVITRRAGLGALMAGAALAGANASFAAAAKPAAKWAGAWGAMLQRQADAPVFDNQTVRQKAVVSLGGERVRVRLSNEFGSKALVIGAASVRAGGKPVKLTFAGAGDITLPPGAPVLSDPVNLKVTAGQSLEVSIYLPKPTQAETVQRLPGGKGGWVSGKGDFTGSAEMAGTTDAPVCFISAVDVLAAGNPPVVVILGDTKSAGPGTWPEFWAASAKGRFGVVNRSQYAGLMALGAPGDAAMARFDRDVLSVAGATHVLIFTGNNDLIQPGMAGSNGKIMMDPSLAMTADQLTRDLAQLSARSRAAGLKAIAGTWLPYEGVTIEGYSAPEKLAKRDVINAWIRSTKAFDGVIDFDAALRDPKNPQRLPAAYDSGNHFTPNEAGYKAMAAKAITTPLP